MKYIITESQSSFLKRRLHKIDELVSIAMTQVLPEDYNYHDYVEEIAWQVADSYRSEFGEGNLEEMLDFVREKYWKIIEDYYLSKK
jgi:hypothetical protein